MRLATMLIFALVLVPVWARTYSAAYGLRQHSDPLVRKFAQTLFVALAVSVCLSVLYVVGTAAGFGDYPFVDD